MAIPFRKKSEERFEEQIEAALEHQSKQNFALKKMKKGYIYYGEGIQVVTPKGVPVPKSEQKLEPMYQEIGERFYHAFTSGATGHGKTVLQELEVVNFVANGYTQIIFDFKPDLGLMDRAKWASDMAGKSDKFRLIAPNYPNHTYYLNPVANVDTPDELVARVIGAIQEDTDEQFFLDTAEMVLMAIARCAMSSRTPYVETKTKDRIVLGKDLTLRTLWRLQSDRVAMQNLMDNAQDEDGRILMNKFLLKPEDYVEKITSTLDVRLARLAIGDFAQTFNPTEEQVSEGRVLDLRREMSTGSVIYFMLPVDLFGPMVYGIAKMVFQTLQSLSNKRQINRDVDQPVAVLADEADKVLYPSIDSFFTRGRSARVAMNLIMQSKWQLVRRLKDAGAGVILSNALTTVWGRCGDYASADYFSELCGEYDKYTESANIRGIGTVGRNKEETTSIGVSQSRERIIKPEELMNLHPGEMLIRSPRLGVWRMRVCMMPDIEHPLSKDLNE